MPIEVLMVDTPGEAKECERILGDGFRVFTFPLRKSELPPAAATRCCYLMSAASGQGELRCLRAMDLLLSAGFPMERIYRIHFPRPIGKRSDRALFQQAFALPVPVDRNLAEAHALSEALQTLIGQNAISQQQAARIAENIVQVAAGALSPEPVEEELASFRQAFRPANPQPKADGMACPSCNSGRVVERRTAKGIAVFGCTRFPQCRFLAWGQPLEEVCPKCSSPYLLEKHLLKASWVICPVKGCSYRRALEKSGA